MKSKIDLHVVELPKGVEATEEQMGMMQTLSLLDALQRLYRTDPKACQTLITSIIFESGETCSTLIAAIMKRLLARAQADNASMQDQVQLRKAQHDMACGLITMAYASYEGDFAKMFSKVVETFQARELLDHPFYGPHLDEHMKAAIRAAKE